LQHVFAQLAGLAFDVEALDTAAALQNLAKDRIVRLRKHVRHIDKPQAETQVGTVETGRVHRLGIGHARERPGQRNAADGEHLDGQLLDQFIQELLVDKRRFDVQLGELRLAVGPQVFIAETASQLKVAFHAADHQQLLEQLRRLRQRVKMVRVNAAGHQVIPRALGRAGRQHGRLDFHKPPRIEKLADALKDAVPGNQVVLHRRAADVQIAVLEPQVFRHIAAACGRCARHHRLVGNGERQRIRFGEHSQFRDQDLDASGLDVGVFRARQPLLDVAPDRDAVFGAQQGGLLADVVGRHLRAEDDLHDAAAVAQVDEQQAAVIPEGIHPAGQQHVAADILRSQFPAKDTFRKTHEKSPSCSTYRKTAS